MELALFIGVKRSLSSRVKDVLSLGVMEPWWVVASQQISMTIKGIVRLTA